MNSISKYNRVFFTVLFLFALHTSFGQFVAHAGSDQTVCPGATVNLSGSASGGLPPYKYSWSPATWLDNSHLSNPTATPQKDITYTLTVKDDTGAVATDVVNITMNYIAYLNAGTDANVCVNGSAQLGGASNAPAAGLTYLWTPSAGLNSTTLPRPTATPTATTTYTLTLNTTGCPTKTDKVTITVIPVPPIDAGDNVTIKEGENVTLHATGAFFYTWWPTDKMNYSTTANPDVQPIVTTKFYVYGKDETQKCPAFDSVTVTVEPSKDVVFYNTFTPNDDGNNDTWYIGNIQKYPNNKLEIYNRYGKLLFKTNGYANTWDGKSFGNELPSGTYFYIMDLGDGEGVYHGTVTIVK